MTNLTLNNGIKMPCFGLGVWKMSEHEAQKAVEEALKVGYRLIDTARAYGNEKGVGKAIKKSNIPRGEIFITTKLAYADEGYDSGLKAFDDSMNDLKLEYLDLYLIHFPVPLKRLESWKALEQIYKSGRCKAIGVSNYTIEHLEELKNNSSIVPVINQVEFHPFLYQKELLNYCNKNNIILEAYSPLTSGQRMNDQVVIDIANKYHKSYSQILLKWSVQNDIIPIPKTTHKDRMEENINIFDFQLDIADMERLNNLNENLRTCWDPSNV